MPTFAQNILMTTNIDKLTKAIVILVIIIHLMFFILEAIFWLNPLVYNVLLVFLDNPVKLDYPTQAIVLKNLFINQGFYNLFLALAGILGFYEIKKGNSTIGYTLIMFLCFCGFGAGIVLAFSTKAYALAFLQAVPAAIGFWRVNKLSKS